jgi:hypothetical protein
MMYHAVATILYNMTYSDIQHGRGGHRRRAGQGGGEGEDGRRSEGAGVRGAGAGAGAEGGR